jgi:tRNA pseudouridine38-40 synthase
MIRANGFLRTMVRTIVGTLLEIGAGRRPAEDIERLLLVRDRGAAGVTAPASGLELAEVAYPLPSDGSQDEQLFSIKW